MTQLETPPIQDRWPLIMKLLTEHEYCEWATPYLRKLCQPFIVLSLSGVAALLCGLLVAPQGFVVLTAIVAVIALGCAWPLIVMQGITSQLHFAAPRTEEGKPVEIELTIINRWPWKVWGLTVEGGFTPAEHNGDPAVIAFSHVAGWSRSYFRWQYIPTMRGHYPLQCPHIVTEFPFGLWKAKRQIDVASKLIVWPERFALSPLDLHHGIHSYTGHPWDSIAGNAGHPTAVREYRRHDSMRQIHWAKTALYDKLVAYEREGLAVTDAIVSLDTLSTLHRGTGRHNSLEWTIRVAASICQTLLRQDIHVTLKTNTHLFRAYSYGPSSTSWLDWFATLKTDDEAPQVTRTTGRSTSHGTSSLAIHITTDLSAGITDHSIVVLTERGTPAPAVDRDVPRCWMTLDSHSDLPAQLRHGWQVAPGRVRHGL